MPLRSASVSEGARNALAGSFRTLVATLLALAAVSLVGVTEWKNVVAADHQSAAFVEGGGWVIVSTADGGGIPTRDCLRLAGRQGIVAVAAVSMNRSVVLNGKGYAPRLGAITFAGDASVLVPNARDNGENAFLSATVAREIGSLENVRLTTDQGIDQVLTRTTEIPDSPRLRKLERRIVVRTWEDTFAQCWVETTPRSFDAVQAVLPGFFGTASGDHVSATALVQDRSGAKAATRPTGLPWLISIIGGLLLALMWFAIDLGSSAEQAVYRLNGATVPQVVTIWVVTRLLSASFAVCAYTAATFLTVRYSYTESVRASGVSVAAAVTSISIAVASYALVSGVRLGTIRPVALLRSA